MLNLLAVTTSALVILLVSAHDSEASSNSTNNPANRQCMDCHEKVIDQWRHSLHAKALSPGVLGQFALFDGETIADCLSCHFPNTETGEALGNWSGSVSCFSCHGHLTSPHPSEVPVTRSPVT
ncbi:MAG: multiheme c-type cytochrome, partial [Candidatus Thiodiazotropha lotti]